MAYYHKHCGGKISILERKCSECGKRWSTSAWFVYPPPRDMTPYIREVKEYKPTTYSKWADRIPLMNIIPRALPNWPRWARISVLVALLAVIVLITVYIRGL